MYVMYTFTANTICTGILIRLVNGSSYYEGRVEMNYNGEWGTVCDDGWDSIDAGVVCRQLGFGSSGTSYSNAYFGQGSGSILLDNVTCTGSESTLDECGYLGGNTRSCSHSKDAGVRCYPPGYNIYSYICSYSKVLAMHVCISYTLLYILQTIYNFVRTYIFNLTTA